jgi:magnesium chelatase family protein
MLWIILTGCGIFRSTANIYDADFSEVKGQAGVKRALEVTVAGGHNIIML